METSTLAEIKKELLLTPPDKLVDICLRLVKYKKVNKELAHYLLFEADNEAGYIEKAKIDISKRFAEMPQNSLFFSTKYIRKTLRLTKQFAQYSKVPQTGIELHIHFCKEMKQCEDYWQNYQVLENFYERIIHQTQKDIHKLHEDLQYDYTKELAELS